ncbi:MAG TPA: mannose-1-phosphate guanylyltransferase [Patescibacteria group bacterium]|nr:mannose-1-phosphate guanylyltransferase [Patescibacteria group bacterium]
MRQDVFHVIMAGGSGTRFWPVSRTGRPKQFLALVGDQSLLRQAFERAAAMSGADKVYIAAGDAHRQMLLGALPGWDGSRFIAEPCARNTAPCVGLSALRLRRVNPDGVMVVAPADHVYSNPDALRAAIEEAVRAARAGDALVTLGIRPTHAETGYGYIEMEDESRAAPAGARRAIRFVEKPDASTAKRYVESGHFLWNSGVFIWKIGAILHALETCAPEIWKHLVRIDKAMGGPDEERVTREAFEAMPSDSIDYAVMEKAPSVLVVPTDPGWSDVGSWDAVAALQDADAAGNSIVSPGAPDADALAINASNNFVYNTTARFISLIGVEDLLIVDSGDALLVCRKSDSQSVRAVVEALRARGRTDLL